MLVRIVLSFVSVSLFPGLPDADCEPNDVTAHVEILGNPLEKTFPSGDRVYARNIWDLQVFDGRLYLGHGNSANSPPAPNASPIDVWSYSPDANEFIAEFRLSDHAIGHYCIVDGRLHIPGHDAFESWDFENFYRRDDDGWKKIRNLRDGIHCFDLYGYDGKMFAALGARRGAVVAISSDGGDTWEYSKIGGGRAYTFFELEKNLYVCTSANSLYQYTGETFRPGAPMKALIPGSKYSWERHIVFRPVRFGEALVYIVAGASYRNQPPGGLYTATSFGDVSEVAIPGRPYDIVSSGGVCYVLSCTEETVAQSGSTRFVIMVHGSEDLTEWGEILRFECETFARSFEVLGGDFYFGLGCNAESLSDSTGRILRVKAAWTETSITGE